MAKPSWSTNLNSNRVSKSYDHQLICRNQVQCRHLTFSLPYVDKFLQSSGSQSLSPHWLLECQSHVWTGLHQSSPNHKLFRWRTWSPKKSHSRVLRSKLIEHCIHAKKALGIPVHTRLRHAPLLEVMEHSVPVVLKHLCMDVKARVPKLCNFLS